jgi:trimeric autotransporter adhesin
VSRTTLAALFIAAGLSWLGTAEAQSILTIAGGGDFDGRPATVTRLSALAGIAVDANGNFVASDVGRVRRVDASSGIMRSVAGNGAAASSGDGGLATQAAIGPGPLDYDSAGNLFVIDTARSPGHVIRRIDATTGIITTYAGGGSSSSDGVPATSYNFGFLYDVDVDSSGNVWAVDAKGVVRIDGVAKTARRVVGGGNAEPGDGGPATAASVPFPKGAVVDETRNILYVTDEWHSRIRKVDLATGIIATVAGGGTSDADGIPATSARLLTPDDLAIDSSGNLYFASLSRIRKVDITTGKLSTIAGSWTSGYGGDGGPATQASFDRPAALTIGSDGAMYIADVVRVRRVGVDGIINTVAGSGFGPYLVVGDGGPATAATLSISSIGGTPMAGVAFDQSGNIYIADRSGARIRRVDADSRKISTIAGTGESRAPILGGPAASSPIPIAYGVAVDHNGNIFFGDNQEILRIDAVSGTLTRVAGGGQSSGEGIPATSALLLSPRGIAVDSTGDLFVAVGYRVWRVAASTGLLTNYAGNGVVGPGPTGDGGPATLARLADAAGLTFGPDGDLYIADSNNSIVRRVSATTGIISTVAGNGLPFLSGDGGPATAAGIDTPFGIGFDAAGNLFIASRGGNRIRKVAAGSGIITTLAGVDGTFNFSPIYAGDNGPASLANLAFPEGLAVDSFGNVVFSDTNANRVREIPACVSLIRPQLQSPSDTSTGVSRAPKLSWSAVRGAFRYDVLLDTVNPPKKSAATDVVSTSVSGSNLDPAQTYYWQVVAKGDPYCPNVSMSSSEIRTFTTRSTCDVPGHVGP